MQGVKQLPEFCRSCRREIRTLERCVILSTREEKRAGEVTFKEGVTEGYAALSAHAYLPEGVRLKLARAHEHLQELRGEIAACFETTPFRKVLY